MKKYLVIFILILSLLFITGCAGKDGPDVTPQDPDEGNNGGSTAEKTSYTITFVDENGNELGKINAEEGTVPSYSYEPKDTAEWNYTLEGWSKTPNGEPSNPSAATESVSYYAIVSKVKQVYTVSFDMGGASPIEAQTLEYGSLATKPEDPTFDAHRFVGWCADKQLTTEFDWSTPVTGNTVIYAKWNERVDIGAYLEALLNGYAMNPTSYLPESMLPGYSENLVSSADVVTDYSDFVKVSDITSHGHGEQWNMIVTNINQSMVFFNLLSVVEALSSTSITAFNNYLDTNTSDTAHHSFDSGIYNVTISFDGTLLLYVIDYTATLPVFGEQTAQIALCMNVVSGEKTARIQAGDANALTYTVLDGSYEFAIKYLGVRRAYFSVRENADGSVSGHIYEYLGVGSAETSSAADFYITEDYVCATGNKSSGMLGFTGYISETYDTESGRLIGYEVEETLSAITYNTVWLDLDSFLGIDSIRYEQATDSSAAKFFVNGSSKAWEAKLVGGFGLKMMSRRFDIEFRTQYFYEYDAQTDSYVTIEAQVPMLFVQEEYLDTLISDVKSTNSITLIPTYTEEELNAILVNYDTLVELFKLNKDAMSSALIVEIIGEKYTFEVAE